MTVEDKFLTMMILSFNIIKYVGQTRNQHLRNVYWTRETNADFFFFPIKLHQCSLMHSVLYEILLINFISKLKPLLNDLKELVVQTTIEPSKWDQSINFYFLALATVQNALIYCVK